MESQVWKGNPALAGMLVATNRLAEDPANARLHPDDNIDAIARSLDGFGQTKNIVVHRFAGRDVPTVIAGNGTLRAAMKLGWTHIAADEFKGTDDEARAYAIADNRTADLSVWDREVLAGQLQRLNDESGAIDLTGFSSEDLADLLEEVEGPGDDPDATGAGGDPGEDNYSQQYGVIVIVEGEAEQAEVYERLSGEGYNCRVVTT